MINLLNMCCMEYMKDIPDKHFDLAICDPPYGIKISSRNNLGSPTAFGGTKGYNGIIKTRRIKPQDYGVRDWDNEAPNNEYFTQLMRVSNNQIIWGANHFIERINKNSSCWIVWDKVNGENPFADCELAWTSFETAVRKVNLKWHGMLQADMKNKEIRIHPTHKPIALYRWILKNYAQEGDKILDTHLGSGSSAIAAFQMGFDFTGTEIDREYYEAAQKRFKLVTSQTVLFEKNGF